jgi:iron complex transport system ATP-binding protein
MDTPAILLEGVTLVRDGRAVLRHIDWTVRPGERWIVLGPNGSGKTSLLQVATTYAFPSRGRAEVLGARFGRSDLREVRPRIGYAGAALERMMAPHLRVLAAVATGKHAMLTTWRERYDEADWDRARSLLGALGVAGLEHRVVDSLSEGERRRVHLARSLMADPELWVLDEPTAGLDLGAREDLVERLAKVAAEPRPSAVVFVTHHVEEIPPRFTHLALLRDGCVLASGSLEETLTSATLSHCFGLPLGLERRHGRWWAWRR